jgi:hypothetical protein
MISEARTSQTRHGLPSAMNKTRRAGEGIASEGRGQFYFIFHILEESRHIPIGLCITA